MSVLLGEGDRTYERTSVSTMGGRSQPSPQEQSRDAPVQYAFLLELGTRECMCSDQLSILLPEVAGWCDRPLLKPFVDAPPLTA